VEAAQGDDQVVALGGSEQLMASIAHPDRNPRVVGNTRIIFELWCGTDNRGQELHAHTLLQVRIGEQRPGGDPGSKPDHERGSLLWINSGNKAWSRM
jgi:hypothetical protein